jgi:hypothetical protein
MTIPIVELSNISSIKSIAPRYIQPTGRVSMYRRELDGFLDWKIDSAPKA